MTNGSQVFVTNDSNKFQAFSANGTTGCTGTPTVCTPIWTGGSLSRIDSAGHAASPTTAYHIGSDARIYAYSANGSTGCSGTPKTCNPLWTATPSVGTSFTSLYWNGALLYAVGSGKLHAFDAAGSTGCTGAPKTCTPLWSATLTGTGSRPTVSGDTLYIGTSDSRISAFSATGTAGCSGSPKTCLPLWTTLTGGDTGKTPAVGGGRVYGALGGTLYAFDAAGTTGCSGNPKVCSPLWSGSPPGGASGSPAYSGGFVYVGGSGLFAYQS